MAAKKTGYCRLRRHKNLTEVFSDAEKEVDCCIIDEMTQMKLFLNTN